MRTVEFPPEWGTAEPVDHEVLQSADGRLTIGTVLLDDGSGLWALIFEGGARFARTAACTGWAIEERFDGDPLPGDAAAVTESWRHVLQSMIRAGHEVDALLGGWR